MRIFIFNTITKETFIKGIFMFEVIFYSSEQFEFFREGVDL